MARLEWHNTERGQWVASSAKCHGPYNLPLTWRVEVNENGKFTVIESDIQLTTDDRMVHTLAEAKGWCEEQEMEL